MDILIKDGLIIDGTGRNGYYADLLIKNNNIREIGEDLTPEDCKVIDASNKVVAPGFIDMHSHEDLTILKVNTAEAYLMQGVTTLAVSICGFGLAPANEKVTKYYADFITKLFGSEELSLYDTLQDYFSRIEEVGISPNLVFFVPHGNIRTCVLGVEERPPTEAELEGFTFRIDKYEDFCTYLPDAPTPPPASYVAPLPYVSYISGGGYSVSPDEGSASSATLKIEMQDKNCRAVADSSDRYVGRNDIIPHGARIYGRHNGQRVHGNGDW